MNKCIIKGCGNINEICNALKTMQTVFGKDATLDEIRKGVEFSKLMTAERTQWEKIKGGIKI